MSRLALPAANRIIRAADASPAFRRTLEVALPVCGSLLLLLLLLATELLTLLFKVNELLASEEFWLDGSTLFAWPLPLLPFGTTPPLPLLFIDSLSWPFGLVEELSDWEASEVCEVLSGKFDSLSEPFGVVDSVVLSEIDWLPALLKEALVEVDRLLESDVLSEALIDCDRLCEVEMLPESDELPPLFPLREALVEVLNDADALTEALLDTDALFEADALAEVDALVEPDALAEVDALTDAEALLDTDVLPETESLADTLVEPDRLWLIELRSNVLKL